MFACAAAGLLACGDPAGPEAALGIASHSRLGAVAPATYTWTADDVTVTGQPGG